MALEELDCVKLFNLEGCDLVELVLRQNVLHLDATCHQAIYVGLVNMEEVQNITLFHSCNLTVLKLVDMLYKRLSQEDEVALGAIDGVRGLEVRQHLFGKELLIAQSGDFVAS